MSISIVEAKAFVKEAEKGGDSHGRENWLYWADRSWSELKKRQPNDRLLAANSSALTRSKKRAKYPAWYSVFRIRQPLLLSRIGIPIGKDTTQDGNDNVGATAATCLERLAKNLPRTFNFFEMLCACRDDFLATNFALCRAYYERKALKQKVKEYITPQQVGEDVTFFDSAGKEVFTDDILQDDVGYFIEIDQIVDVEEESVCLEPLLYKDVLIDPDVRRWGRVKRIAFVEYYSAREFREIFGERAYQDIPKEPQPGEDEATPKTQNIKVYEYWDMYEPECKWWADNGPDFIKPLTYPEPKEDDAEEQLNGLYNLEGLFPCPPPLTANAPTDDFWPIPEYAQVKEILDDVHGIFGKMIQLTKAIRPRFLFDSGVEGLKAGLNELSTSEGIGIDGLAQNLAGGDGDLRRFVQYVPVDQMIEGLNQLYVALEQRLSVFFKITGTSDLLQGLTTEQSGKTLGERQIEEKYATNQLYEPQRKMADFVRDCYQLMCEMALKNFKDESLDMYIMPQTLQPGDQQRYRAALGLLKNDSKRFRIELETDSTIALNEQYDKQMRMEFVNALTSALEKTAGVAETQPALLVPTLHCLKYLIQGFRQAKLFQDEITQAIDQVIEQASQPKPPAFNKDEALVQVENQKLQLEAQRMQMDAQLEQIKIQSNERLERWKLQQDQSVEMIKAQLDQFKAQSATEQAGAELNFKYGQLQAEISEAQQKLENDRASIMVELTKIADKKEVEQYKLMIEQQTAPYEQALQAQAQSLEAARLEMQTQQQLLEHNHVEVDNMLQAMRLKLDAQALKQEQQKPVELPPITINLPAATTKKSIKVKRDQLGNIESLDAEDIAEAIK